MVQMIASSGMPTVDDLDERDEERPSLIGQPELAELLGVSRQRVSQLALGRGKRSLPEPAAHLARGRVWYVDDVVAWCVESGRAEAILELHGRRA